MENNVVLAQSPSVPARDVSVITEEIRSLVKQANQMALMYAIEIGRRLLEAKSAVPYGQWGDYLKNEVNFSQSTANNFSQRPCNETRRSFSPHVGHLQQRNSLKAGNS